MADKVDKKKLSDEINDILGLKETKVIDWSKLKLDDLLSFRFMVEGISEKLKQKKGGVLPEGGLLGGILDEIGPDDIAMVQNRLQKFPIIARIANRFVDKALK